MQATVVKTKRRTLCVQISPEKGLIIRAPRHLSEARIEGFLKEKESWIRKKLAQAKNQQSTIPKYSFTEGELHPYLGEMVLPPVHTRAKIIDWYKMKAEAYLNKRTNELKEVLAEKTHARLPLTKTKVRFYRSRWGTCSRDNTITYNWKIIMAPPEIIDYLVSHELSHILHKNHGRGFYATLSLLDPNYKAHQKWLKSNGYHLTI